VPFQPSGRFGSSLAVLDFNKDGVPDLAVGAPSVGSEQLTYKVRLLVMGKWGMRGGKGTAGRVPGARQMPPACQANCCGQMNSSSHLGL
jgi:hypothetical protein